MCHYVLVVDAGSVDEKVVAEFGSYSEALKSSLSSYKLNETEIMMKLVDGSLTTDF